MKRVTASDARKNWFRLLDEAAAGEVVVIERAGTRILIQRESASESGEDTPDYTHLLSAPSLAEADRWSWEWDPAGGDLAPSDAPSDAGDE
jgi:hypothetical protein